MGSVPSACVECTVVTKGQQRSRERA